MRALSLTFVARITATGARRLVVAAAVVMATMVATGCTTYESAYEEGVADYEPIYCYRSLADVTCYRKPYARDEARLENYYGPHPRRYPKPEARPAQTLAPPPAIDHFERAPEPKPMPKPAPRVEARPAQPPAEEEPPIVVAPEDVSPEENPSI